MITPDIFISFRNHDENGKPTRDSELAKEVYDFLSGQKFKVFLSSVSLEEIGNAAYKREIDKALESAMILIAIGTSSDNLKWGWVEYEWSSFINEIISGDKPKGQVFSYIEGGGRSMLPFGLRQFQFFSREDNGLEKLKKYLERLLMQKTPIATHPSSTPKRKGRVANSYKLPREWITSITFNSRGDKVLAGDRYGGIYSFDIKSKKVSYLEKQGSYIRAIINVPGKPDQILTVASSSSKAILWKFVNKLSLEALIETGLNSHIWSVDISKDGRNLIAGSQDGSCVIVKDICNKPRIWRSWNCEGTSVKSCKYLHNEEAVIVGYKDGSIAKYSVNPFNGKAIWRKELQKEINEIDIQNDDRYAAIAMNGGYIAMFDLSNRACKEFQLHNGNINDCALLPNGKYLATASSDCTIKLLALDWDNGAYKEVHEYIFDYGIQSVAWNNKGDLIAAGDREIEKRAEGATGIHIVKPVYKKTQPSKPKGGTSKRRDASSSSIAFELPTAERLRKLEEVIMAKRRASDVIFPGLDNKDSKNRVTLVGANHFFLGCINDMRQPVEKTWGAARNFVYQIAPNPETIWDFIANSHTSESWLEKKKTYKLHYVDKDFMRNYRIAHQIVEKYKGDPRNIWERDATGLGEEPSVILDRLLDRNFRMGPNISFMVIGALKDENIISGKTDIKADVNVTRVLGRVIRGGSITPDVAIILAREIHPSDPWEIDQPLYLLGQNICGARFTSCGRCFLSGLCEYRRVGF